MKCPKCGFKQPAHNEECIRCGIIFKKFQKQQRPNPSIKNPQSQSLTDANIPKANTWEWIRNFLFFVKQETNPIIFGGRVLVFLMIFIWGLKFIFTPLETNYTGESLWHLVNLPFHEAGHIIFRPFGKFITSLGGSLGQVLMPLICMATFLIKTRDTFAASFCLWWTGENFMDMAPYINDARSLTLPLLGGNVGYRSPYGFHDWEYILKESGFIQYDHLLANLSYKFGTVLMVISFLWGGYMLYKQYKTFKN